MHGADGDTASASAPCVVKQVDYRKTKISGVPQ